MPRKNRKAIAAVAAALISFAPLLSAGAQETQVIFSKPLTPQAGGGAAPGTPPQPPRPLNTLAEALEVTSWDVARRGNGPLLVIAPQTVRPWAPRRDLDMPHYRPTPGLPPPTARNGHRLDAVADFFGRKIVRLGSLTVLAPKEMVLLNTAPGKPDPFGSLSRSEKMRLFQAALSAAQWRTLGSARGLGTSDLTAEQRDLYLSLLPEPFNLQKGKVMAGGGIRFESRGPNDTGLVTLSPAQRASVRLRLNRAVNMSIPAAGGTGYGTSVSGKQVNTDIFTLRSGRNEWQRPDAFGATLRQEVPSRLKRGDLNLEAPALAVPITLDGAKTVDDLIKRVAQATQTELYADGRVGKMPIWFRGVEGTPATARAGDVLKALCWAVTGTFRKLPDGDNKSVYLLTDDVEGIATRRARLAEWSQEGMRLTWEQQRVLDERIRKQQPLQYTGFAPDDALALSPELMRRIEERWNTWEGRYQGESLKVTDLPASHRALVNEAIAAHQERQQNQQGQNIRPLQTDKVNLSVQMKASFLIPGLGSVDDSSMGFGSLNSMLPPPSQPRPGSADQPAPSTDPVTLPAPMATNGALYVAPVTPEEAVEAARAAYLRGLRHIWIETPLEARPEDTATLAAAIKAGRERGMAVFAVARLLQKTPPDQAASAAPEVDLNILGETGAAWAARRMRSPMAEEPRYRSLYQKSGDWLLVDAATTLPRLKRELLRLAETPGLTGIVVRDTAAPGYAQSQTMYGESSDFGYTLARRLAFLRQHGYDPIDLSSDNAGIFTGSGSVDLNLPFFANMGVPYVESDGQWEPDKNFVSPATQWSGLRYRANAKLMADLYAAVRAAKPQMPLLMRERSNVGPTGWYGSWDRADALPARSFGAPAFGADERRMNSLQMARAQSRRVFLNLTYLPGYPGVRSYNPIVPDVKPDTPEAFAHYVSTYMNFEKGNWDGIVFDLSSVSVPQALGLLHGLAAPGSAAPAPAPKRAAAAVSGGR